MDRFNTLHPKNYTKFKTIIDHYKNKVKDDYVNNKCIFFKERYEPHITYLYFGKQPFLKKKEILEECTSKFNKLSENEKKIKLDTIKLLRGRRADFVVVELEVHEKIKKIREEIYKKFDIKDTHTDYNPHITLGKLKNFQDFRPYPTTKVIFDCELK